MLDQLAETANSLQPIVQLVGGLGLLTVLGTVLLAVLQRTAQRRQWRNYKGGVVDWSYKLLAAGTRHPKELTDEEWKSVCERMLYNAQFTPTEICQILDLAIIVAMAISFEIFDRG